MLFYNNFVRLEKIFERCAVDSDNKQEDHQINHQALAYLPDSNDLFKQFIFTIEHNGEFAGYLHISICIEHMKLELEHIYVMHHKRNKLLSYRLIDNAVAELKESNISIFTVETTRTTSGGEKCFYYLNNMIQNYINPRIGSNRNGAHPKKEWKL